MGIGKTNNRVLLSPAFGGVFQRPASASVKPRCRSCMSVPFFEFHLCKAEGKCSASFVLLFIDPLSSHFDCSYSTSSSGSASKLPDDTREGPDQASGARAGNFAWKNRHRVTPRFSSNDKQKSPRQTEKHNLIFCCSSHPCFRIDKLTIFGRHESIVMD